MYISIFLMFVSNCLIFVCVFLRNNRANNETILKHKKVKYEKSNFCSYIFSNILYNMHPILSEHLTVIGLHL